MFIHLNLFQAEFLQKASYFRNPYGHKLDAIIVPAQYQMYNEIPKEEYASYNLPCVREKNSPFI